MFTHPNCQVYQPHLYGPELTLDLRCTSSLMARVAHPDQVSKSIKLYKKKTKSKARKRPTTHLTLKAKRNSPQSGRAMDHVHHEQARHSSRGSLVRAKAGKVAFVMRMSIGVIMRMLMGVIMRMLILTMSDERGFVRTKAGLG